MTRSARVGWSAAALAAVLLVAPLAGCAGTGPAPTESTTSEGQDVDLQPLYSAVTAADARVEDPTAIVNYSGTAKTLDLAVLIRGDEPVSTQTLTAILVAARDATPDEIATISVLAREAADEERIVDLQDAIAGLPAGVTALWDGAATLARVDLDKL